MRSFNFTFTRMAPIKTVAVLSFIDSIRPSALPTRIFTREPTAGSKLLELAFGGKTATEKYEEEKKFDVTNGHIHFSAVEHCIQEENDEVFVDGVTGKNTPELKRYMSLSPQAVTGDLESSVPEGSILVPPQTRVSAIMRDSLSKMIKGIQADTILEESVEVTCVDLYYHPIFAYQYRWKSKAKEAILEIDGMTGEVGVGSRTFSEYMGRVLDRNFLFDIGADAVGMFVPGGSVAVKLAKKYIDNRKEKS